MPTNSPLTLVNKQNGNLAFKYLPFDDGRYFDHVQRNNYYSLIWVTEGTGKVKVDFAEHSIQENIVFSFSPYQPFMFSAERMTGVALQFHPDFFCIHKHQEEVSCNGVLFNNIYNPPFTLLDTPTTSTLHALITQIRNEMESGRIAQYEILISYLKIFIINVTRLKAEQDPQALKSVAAGEPFVLQKLKDAIEQNFKIKHSPSDYAYSLNITPKALARLTKSYFNRTITELISERIIIEAKRELYLTQKTVKEIAYELGYEDEYYFSRFFKSNVTVSPQIYRETIGFDREGHTKNEIPAM